MSMLDLDLGNVPEKEIMPDDEYSLKIFSADRRDSRSGKPMLVVGFEFVDHSNAQEVYQNFLLPQEEEEERANNNRLRRIKQFCEAFGIDVDNPFSTDDLIGETGWAIVSERHDEEYGHQNQIRRFVVGH